MHALKHDPTRRILVVPQESGGSGDLNTAALVANMLVERGGVSVERICLASQDPEAMTSFNNRGFQVIALSALEKFRDGISLIIIAPLTFLVPPPVLHLRVPTAGFWEYDLRRDGEDWTAALPRWTTTATFGLSKESIGFFVDSELREWAQSSASKDPVQRLQKLQGLPPHLQIAILGQPYSSRAIEQCEAKLFICYCHRWRIQRAAVLAFQEKYPQQPLVIICPSWFKCAPWQKDRTAAEIIEYNAKDDTWKVLEKAEMSQTRIITGSFPKQLFRLLQMAAEKETVRTGDGSLAEAISLDSRFVYEALAHKEGVRNELARRYGYSCCIGANIEGPVAGIARQIQDHWERDCSNITAELVEKGDVWPRMFRILDELLQSARRVSIPPLCRDDQFTPSTLPCNKPLFAKLEQILFLQIRMSDGRSARPQWRGSTFTTELIQTDLYLLVRHTEEGAPEVEDAPPRKNCCQIFFQAIAHSLRRLKQD